VISGDGDDIDVLPCMVGGRFPEDRSLPMLHDEP